MPSRSEGSRPPIAELCWKQICVADLSIQHGGAVVGAGVGSNKGVAVKHVEGFVVSVGPDSHLGIVVKIVVLEGVAVIAAGSVRRFGNGNALQVRSCRDGKLAEDPALRKFVVKHNRIAIIVGLASTPEA